MPEPIVFVESFRIRAGKAETLRTVLAEVCATVESREPQLIAYKIYVNDEGTAGMALHIHRGSASLDYHQGLMAEVMLPVAELIELVNIDVCGELPGSQMQRVHAMAEAFGDVSVIASPFQVGFVRSR